MLGPAGPGDDPSAFEIPLRRYRCQHCGTVTVSAPRGVLKAVRYTAVAIAMALSLWAEGEPGWRIRQRVSPWRSEGTEREHGWRSLRRWARSAWRLWPGSVRAPDELGDARGLAEQAVAQLGARALFPTGDLRVDAPLAAVGL